LKYRRERISERDGLGRKEADRRNTRCISREADAANGLAPPESRRDAYFHGLRVPLGRPTDALATPMASLHPSTAAFGTPSDPLATRGDAVAVPREAIPRDCAPAILKSYTREAPTGSVSVPTGSVASSTDPFGLPTDPQGLISASVGTTIAPSNFSNDPRPYTDRLAR